MNNNHWKNNYLIMKVFNIDNSNIHTQTPDLHQAEKPLNLCSWHPTNQAFSY